MSIFGGPGWRILFPETHQDALLVSFGKTSTLDRRVTSRTGTLQGLDAGTSIGGYVHDRNARARRCIVLRLDKSRRQKYFLAIARPFGSAVRPPSCIKTSGRVCQWSYGAAFYIDANVLVCCVFAGMYPINR